MASLVAQLVKNLPAIGQMCPMYQQKYGTQSCFCGRPGFDPWVGKIPWRRERLPTPVFWPREFYGVAKSRTRLSNFHFHVVNFRGFSGGTIGKESACQGRRRKKIHGTWVRSLRQENPLEKEKAVFLQYTSLGYTLQSMGSQKSRTQLSIHACRINFDIVESRFNSTPNCYPSHNKISSCSFKSLFNHI